MLEEHPLLSAGWVVGSSLNCSVSFTSFESLFNNKWLSDFSKGAICVCFPLASLIMKGSAACWLH